MVTGSFRYGPGGKKEYRIGGRLVEASSLAEALEVARRNMQYEMEDMPEGALSYRTPDMNRMRESDQAEEAETLRQQAAMASGRAPAQYDSGRARVPEGDQPWLRDPRILQPPPGGWPHAERFGMDVADLARRAGVSEGQADEVIRYMMEGNLPPAYYSLGLEDDDPNYINLGGGYGRKTPQEWNRASGQVWSDPQMMRKYKLLLDNPNALYGGRSTLPSPGGEPAKRVYRTLLGMDPEAQQFAIGGKTYRADNFEAALRKFNADPARLDNRGNPTTITLPTATTEQAASTALDQPAARPISGTGRVDWGDNEDLGWYGGGPRRTATEFIPRGDADRGMQFVDEYSGDYFPTTGPRRAVGGGAMTGWGDNEDLGWGDYATPGTMGIGPAGDASLDPTTQTIYSPTPVGRMRHFMPPDRGMEFVDEYSGAYYPTTDPRRMMGWGDNEDLGWYGGAMAQTPDPYLGTRMDMIGPTGLPETGEIMGGPGRGSARMVPPARDERMWMGGGPGRTPTGSDVMLDWGDEEMGYGMGPRIPAGLPTAGNIGTLDPEGGVGYVGPQQNLVAPLSEQNFSPFGRYGEEGQNQPPPIPTMVKPGQMPETIGGRRNLEEFFGAGNIDLVRRLAFNQFLGDRFPQGSTGIGQDFYRGLRSPLESDFSLSTLLGKATGSIEDYYANLGDLPQLSEWNPRLRDAASIIGASPEQGGLTEAQRSVYTPLRTGEGQIDQFNMAITPQMRALPASLRNDFYQAALQKFYDVLARESLPTPSASEWGEGGQEPAADPRSFAEAGSFQFLPWYVNQGFDMWGGGRNYDPYGME